MFSKNTMIGTFSWILSGDPSRRKLRARIRCLIGQSIRGFYPPDSGVFCPKIRSCHLAGKVRNSHEY